MSGGAYTRLGQQVKTTNYIPFLDPDNQGYLEINELRDPLQLNDLLVDHVQVHDDVVVVHEGTFRILL